MAVVLFMLARTRRALRASQEQARGLAERLRQTNEAAQELTRATSPDALCKLAVQLGHERLGFDHLSIWFLDDAGKSVAGSFGIDENGAVRDERGQCIDLAAGSPMGQMIAEKAPWRHWRGTPLLSGRGEQAVEGDQAIATMWDGERIAGFVSTDNLLGGRIIDDHECELLALYAATVSHVWGLLCDRERLREGEVRYRALLDTLPAAVFAFRDGRCVFANPAAARLLGYGAPERLIGTRPTDPIAPRMRPAVQKRLANVADGVSNPPIELEMVRQDGQPLWVEATSVPIVLDGEPAALIISQDITKRRQAQQQVIRARDRARRYLELARVMFVAIGADHRVTMVNRRGCEVLGYEESQIVGQNWFEMFLPETLREGVVAVFDQLMAGEVELVEYHENSVLTRSGEERLIAWHNTILRDDAGNIVGTLSAGDDMTDRKREERLRRRFEEQLQHTQKLESLGVLAGGIAHDFNNLLMGVLGNADLALMELSPVSPVRGYLQEIEKAGRRAADLCRQMLAYSGKGRFVVQPVSLSDVVQEMAHMLEVSISKKVALRYDFAKALPAVEADVAQLRQIIMNLVINASEAIGDETGVVSVHTGSMQCDRAYLLSGHFGEDLPEGTYVFLEVADTGCGMDEETQQRLFDPFFSTKFTGRGLGLSAVLGIVRGHRGAIKVYTEVGKGSTFKVLLPASQGRAGAVPTLMGPTEAPSQLEGTVLLADDEGAVRSVGKRMLETAGLTVLLATDGREALDTFRERSNEIGCVVLDLTMPRMDGEECFREMRRIKPDVRVVLSSGYNEQDVVQRFAGKGLAGFIQKPYHLADLIEAVKTALDAS